MIVVVVVVSVAVCTFIIIWCSFCCFSRPSGGRFSFWAPLVSLSCVVFHRLFSSLCELQRANKRKRWAACRQKCSKSPAPCSCRDALQSGNAAKGYPGSKASPALKPPSATPMVEIRGVVSVRRNRAKDYIVPRSPARSQQEGACVCSRGVRLLCPVPWGERALRFAALHRRCCREVKVRSSQTGPRE